MLNVLFVNFSMWVLRISCVICSFIDSCVYMISIAKTIWRVTIHVAWIVARKHKYLCNLFVLLWVVSHTIYDTYLKQYLSIIEVNYKTRRILRITLRIVSTRLLFIITTLNSLREISLNSEIWQSKLNLLCAV